MRRATVLRLRRIAVFDAVINNADRKGGHLLPTPRGHIYGVDHGVSFHVEDKLRTVLWQWAGRTAAGRVRRTCCARCAPTWTAELGERLGELLTTARGAAHPRAGSTCCCSTGRHPEPSGDWPPCPGRRCSSAGRGRRALGRRRSASRSRVAVIPRCCGPGSR